MKDLINKAAPNFSATDQEGKEHKLTDYSGKYVLLYFYPKDDTPGCTIEACEFRDQMNDLVSTNVQVLGVSADDEVSHKKFADKFNLNFPLLADVNKKIVQDYDVLKEKSMFGKKYMGIQRDSFLISPEGVVLKHYKKVKPKEHPAKVLEDVKSFR